MLISYRHRLVILSMPKCASEALAQALGPHMDIVMWNAPVPKHTPYRRFDRFLRPFVESSTKARVETVCLFREPEDWLRSWWRYRARPGIPDPAKSTRGQAFESFVRAYLDGQTPPGDIGRQSRFVADREGAVGVDRVFRHDRMDAFLAFLQQRLDRQIQLDRLNSASVTPGPDALSDATRARLRAELSRDYDIYREIAV